LTCAELVEAPSKSEKEQFLELLIYNCLFFKKERGTKDDSAETLRNLAGKRLSAKAPAIAPSRSKAHQPLEFLGNN
jgi:hypothetical protein